LKNCVFAIITSLEVIIAEYDAILGQPEHENFYNHLSNYTNVGYHAVVSNKSFSYKFHENNFNIHVNQEINFKPRDKNNF